MLLPRSVKRRLLEWASKELARGAELWCRRVEEVPDWAHVDSVGIDVEFDPARHSPIVVWFQDATTMALGGAEADARVEQVRQHRAWYAKRRAEREAES